MAIRVIQWATGPVGISQLREIIDNPDYELVGLFVYGSEKIGRDAGRIAQRADTGIIATNDKTEILALDADVVLHAASKAYGFDQNTADIIALLESGKNVITTTSYAHLPTLGEEVADSISEACLTGGARFHGAGKHPGFVFERLAILATTFSQRIDNITLRQYVDCSHVPEERMLVDLMGMGKSPDEISMGSPAFRAVSVQAEQALAAGAQMLGLPVDEIRHVVKTAVSDQDLLLPCTTLRAGTVIGQILSWSAFHAGKPVLTCEEYWTCTKDIPGWDINVTEGSVVRILIEGTPNMSLDLNIDTAPDPDGMSGGYVALAMSAINAIPYILREKPGVILPEMFGAYRWRA